MKMLTAVSLSSLFSIVASSAAFALSPAPVAAPSPTAASGAAPVEAPEPETLVGRPPSSDARVSGWFIAPTFTTTSFADTVAYGPGLRGGIYLNRRIAVGATVTALGLQESSFEDHRATNVGAYGGLLVQYVVQSNRLVHVTVESTLARGRWCTEIGDGKEGTRDGCQGRNFVAFEPVANIEINVARHVRVDAGVGYRFAATTASGSVVLGTF
jgi:hypothetical protein